MIKLYPFQEEAVELHLTARYSLNFSEMGTGKTFMALMAAKRSGERVVVFGPAFLAANWHLEAFKFNLEIKYIPYSRLKGIQPKALERYGFWIADEIHYLKNPQTQRTDFFHTLLKAVQPRYFVGLTGTPVENRVPEIWTSLVFCCMDLTAPNGLKLEGKLKFYHKFARYFCNIEKFYLYGKCIQKYVGLKRRKELKALLRGKYIRFLLDKVVDDIPELVRKKVTLGLTDDDEMLDTFQDYMDGGQKDSRAKAQSALLKVKSTVTYVKELIEQGEQVVVFTDHVEPAMKLAADLGGEYSTGKVPAAKRAEMVARFQAGKIKVLAATIGSLSIGVTLHAARHVVFNDIAWVPGKNSQAEARIKRIGQKRTCIAHYLFSTSTDEYIYETVVEKQETINEVLGE